MTTSSIPFADILRPATGSRWLVTGAAGFIGSNLVETLLRQGLEVVGLDSLVTGFSHNLTGVRDIVGEEAWSRFQFVEGDIRSLADCETACKGVDFVLHQAALGSVPRSIAHPEATNDANVGGFVNMLSAAKSAGVKRLVYASSSSVYGDEPNLPKVEDRLGKVLSPYALSKLVNEQYAAIFARCYGMECIGMRYFNVFGPRQDPLGAYAAVIPLWYAAMLKGEPIYINGDGETSRDFCFVANVVQANLRAALTTHPEATNRAYNVACGDQTTLNQLVSRISESIKHVLPDFENRTQVIYREFRPGDVRHSLADTSLSERLLGYQPTHQVAEGLLESAEYYVRSVLA
jgi:UDP-N-acetylglucosamine 4-epimerase